MLKTFTLCGELSELSQKKRAQHIISALKGLRDSCLHLGSVTVRNACSGTFLVFILSCLSLCPSFSLSFQQWTHEQHTHLTLSRIRSQLSLAISGLTQCYAFPLPGSSQCSHSTLFYSPYCSQPCGEQWPKVPATSPGLLSEQRCPLTCCSHGEEKPFFCMY